MPTDDSISRSGRGGTRVSGRTGVATRTEARYGRHLTQKQVLGMSCTHRGRLLLNALTVALFVTGSLCVFSARDARAQGDGEEAATTPEFDSTTAGSGDAQLQPLEQSEHAESGAREAPSAPDESEEASASAVSEPDIGTLVDRIGELSRWARELEFDPMAVSVDARAASFRSVEEAQRWVRENIAFEVYAGSIRGARGTLLAGAGNALDRALLLGAIAESMGFDWRLVRGNLSAEDTTRLLLEVTPDGQLTGSGVPRDANGYRPAADARRNSVASDHYWVRVRDRGTWRDADPTLPWVEYGDAAVPGGDSFSPEEITPDAIHRATLTIRAYDQRGSATTLVEHEVALPDLAYRSATVSASRVAGELFIALEVEGAQSEAAPLPVSEAERIELEFSRSTRTSVHRTRRDLYVRTEAFPERETHVLVFLPGPVGDDYLHAVLAVLLGDVAVDLSAARESAGRGNTSSDSGQLERASELSLAALALSWAHLSDRVAAATGAALGARPTFDTPRVLVASHTVDADRSELRLDALVSEGSTLPVAGVPSAAGHAVEALRGLIEADVAVELVALASMAQPSSPGAVIRAAREAGASFVTVHGGTVARLPSLGLPEAFERRLSELVTTRGGIALAPNRMAPDTGGARYGWWELVPGTPQVRVIQGNGSAGASAPLLRTPADATADASASRGSELVLVDGVLRAARHAVTARTAGQDAVCSAVCDLREMRRSVCSDERDRNVPTAGSCMRGDASAGGAGFLPVGRSCSAQLATFYCGAALAESAARGEIAFTPDPSPGAPSPIDIGSDFSLTDCTCDAP